MLEIDYLIFCTQSPDFFLPTSACLIQDRLGLRTEIGAVDINQGCSGFVYALSLAKGLIESDQVKNVLIITSETYSKYINNKDKSVRTLFGDAACCTARRNSDACIGSVPALPRCMRIIFWPCRPSYFRQPQTDSLAGGPPPPPQVGCQNRR